MNRPLRVLLAKPGLDGHDRGAKIVARVLRDAGVEVIYTGLRQSVEQILSAAADEDADVIALSILSGAHIGLTKKLLARAAEFGVSDVPVVIGGTIPPADARRLLGMGVVRVFDAGTDLDDIVDGVRSAVSEMNGSQAR